MQEASKGREVRRRSGLPNVHVALTFVTLRPSASHERCRPIGGTQSLSFRGDTVSFQNWERVRAAKNANAAFRHREAEVQNLGVSGSSAGGADRLVPCMSRLPRKLTRLEFPKSLIVTLPFNDLTCTAIRRQLKSFCRAVPLMALMSQPPTGEIIERPRQGD